MEVRSMSLDLKLPVLPHRGARLAATCPPSGAGLAGGPVRSCPRDHTAYEIPASKHTLPLSALGIITFLRDCMGCICVTADPSGLSNSCDAIANVKKVARAAAGPVHRRATFWQSESDHADSAVQPPSTIFSGSNLAPDHGSLILTVAPTLLRLVGMMWC